METLCVAIVAAPLAGALVAGLLGARIGRAASHRAAILGVTVAFALSLVAFKHIVIDDEAPYDGTVYTWAEVGGLSLSVGFLLDELSVTLMVVVSFVSLMVHIYTIGYMADDPGYQRFFSYIALFTFSMLMLVMSDNFLQLFFGWEAVGLVSYLLIGFWYTRESAIYASLKAFLVNRVGDLGFLLGIALLAMYAGSLDYGEVFAKAPALAGKDVELWQGTSWNLVTVICLLLFAGAMGKSAQMPLHVWLPDSMEGPTPISALIHAATMVTAGIFMVARLSPLFELSETALSFIIVIGALTALSMALIAVVHTDIKRVIAYSTLSQLGYMTVALGASAYPAAIFHLVTHAFFKALLFLAAGSVIIALHHEQDMRRMGGLRKYMPVTYGTMLVAAVASSGVPGFSGFFSKDAIIEAARLTGTPGGGFAYWCVLLTVFITAFYTFRLVFLTFHGAERFAVHGGGHHEDGNRGHAGPRESPAVVTVPLLVLAVPTVASGWVVGPVLFGGYFGAAIHVAEGHGALAEMARGFHGVWGTIGHSLAAAPFWLATAGIAAAAYLYLVRPGLPQRIKRASGVLATILERKYGFDEFNELVFARLLGRGTGRMLWRVGDVTLIDGVGVNGSARTVGWMAGVVRHVQSGYLYHYAFAMIVAILLLLAYFVHGLGR